MSLINDALKRAKQAQQQNPSGGTPVVPLQPVDDARPPSLFLRSMVAILAVVTLACSGWFFWKWWTSQDESPSAVAAVIKAKTSSAAQSKAGPLSSSRKSAIQVSTNIVVRTTADATPSNAAAPPADALAALSNVVATPTNAAATLTNTGLTPTTGTEVRSVPTNASISTSQTNAATPAPVAVPAPPPSPFADLKLRSIIYRADKPAAVINGDMLYIGDEIRGARVVRIQRHTVTVERNGETNELRLPRL